MKTVLTDDADFVIVGTGADRAAAATEDATVWRIPGDVFVAALDESGEPVCSTAEAIAVATQVDD